MFANVIRSRIRAFTLVELLVVIGIIALLISILLPALSKARNQATLVQCSAQMRDIFVGIQSYAADYKGSLPGPTLGQIRAGYYTDIMTMPEYLVRYMKLPTPAPYNAASTLPGSNENHPIIIKSLLCPGARMSNQFLDEAQIWTYSMEFWDPYPWCGYTKEAAFPLRPTLHPESRMVINNSQYTNRPAIKPMKLSQIFSAAEMPFISESDYCIAVFTSDAAGLAADKTASTYLPKKTAHGGKGETGQGVDYTVATINGVTTTTPWIRVLPPYTAPGSGISIYATNPPRNWLFADGHVKTIRKSGPVIPPQLDKYAPRPDPTGPWMTN